MCFALSTSLAFLCALLIILGLSADEGLGPLSSSRLAKRQQELKTAWQEVIVALDDKNANLSEVNVALRFIV